MPLLQTKRAWPRKIENLEDIPQAFKPYFEKYLGGDFPYVVFDPAERAFTTRVHAKVICALSDEIRIYEKEKTQVKETCIKVEEINYIEFGTILLYSWITVNFSGSKTGLKLVFNSTAEPLYKPVLSRLRSMCPEENDAEANPKTEEERDKFDFLIKQNHKFMNFGRKSIEPGEEIRRILYQPEIKVPYLKLFGKTFYKSLLKASLVVLTGTELILIREPEDTRTDIAGVKWYLPLRMVKRMNAGNSADLKKCLLEIVFHDESRLTVELGYSKYEEAKTITESLRLQAGALAGV